MCKENFQKSRTHKLDVFPLNHESETIPGGRKSSSLLWASGSSAVKRRGWKTRLKNTVECKTKMKSGPFCLSTRHPFQFFKHCSSSEGGHNRMKTFFRWTYEHLESGHLKHLIRALWWSQVVKKSCTKEGKTPGKGQKEDWNIELFEVLKLRMNLNLQKTLKLPRRHLKNQKEWVKQYNGLIIRKSRKTELLFVSLSRRCSLAGQK